MEIKLDKSKPWLQQSKTVLYKLALKETNGNKQEAAKLLGCAVRTVRTEVKKNKALKEFYVEPKVQTINPRVKFLFNLNCTISEISQTLNIDVNRIKKILERFYSPTEIIKLNNQNNFLKNRGERMFDADEILNNNRAILADIAEKIRENKTDELSEEHFTYAKILFQNKFINEKGEVTEEGINALYY